jgi:hypothetical protein
MKSLNICAVASVFVAVQVLAQSPTRPPANPSQDPAAQPANSGVDTHSTDPSVNMGRNPSPSTQQTEGTTENHRAPTAPPTRDSTLTGPSDMGGPPQPSTGSSESAAVTQESEQPTPATGTQTQVAAEPAIAGTEVVSVSDQPLGSVVETVFDSQGQPAFVVISSGESMAALPYDAARTMMSGQKLVIDRTRLAQAPKVQPGEWHENQSWQAPSTRYWSQR